jgi:SAM-dependent methyltransferase
MESAWDVVIDGGTLEHVFNFPVAIANCMRLLKTGGSLFIFSMANNHCGHGFYQFSPELFFRIFRAENGFELKSAILVRHPFPGAELGGSQDCFQVTDPAILRRRTSLVTRSPLGIMVHAVKTAHVPPFRVSPQQSDYAAEWKRDHGDAKRENGRRSLWRTAWEKLPFAIRRRAAGYRPWP